ncbi:MAG: hypothetical protein ACP5T4_00420 [Candidatus Micrarchaeia archaeon]
MLAYAAYAKPDIKYLAEIFAAALAGLALAFYTGESAALLISGILINSLFIRHVKSKRILAILPFALFFIFSALPYYLLIAQSFLLALLSNSASFAKGIRHRLIVKQEIERDLLQLSLGVLAFASFLILGANAYPAFFTAFDLLLCFAAFVIASPKSKISKWVYSLERSGAAFGYGAFWLSVGSFLALSFLSFRYLLVVFSALFFGDTCATIFGIKMGKHALPYNRRKTFEGALAYFLVVLAVSSMLVGFFEALAFAFVGMLAESIRLPTDDNVNSSVALVILALLLH